MKNNEMEYAEHSVRKVPGVGVLLILIPGFSALTTATYFLWRIAWFIGALAALGFGALFVYFGFIRTRIEYEYTISDGIWRFVRTQGGRIRQTLIELPLENVIRIVPYTKENRKNLKDILDFRRTFTATEGVYIAKVRLEGKEHYVFFHATDKVLKIFASKIEKE